MFPMCVCRYVELLLDMHWIPHTFLRRRCTWESKCPSERLQLVPGMKSAGSRENPMWEAGISWWIQQHATDAKMIKQKENKYLPVKKRCHWCLCRYEPTPVFGCCQENQVIAPAELIYYFLPPPAAPPLVWIMWRMLLWTHLCREPPAALCMCEKQSPDPILRTLSAVVAHVCVCLSIMDIWR